MTKKIDFPYIRAWGRMMGSFGSYIELEVDHARQTNAPYDAIYERGGKWQTYNDITSYETRRTIWHFVKDLGIELKEPVLEDFAKTYDVVITRRQGGVVTELYQSEIDANGLTPQIIEGMDTALEHEGIE
jgi:hypothetical protein